ncbi:MAG TPA: DUF4440 domain-containing protein [Flavobacterium sp.]|jgi:ketosteroid isomerase-like protein|nr:DUF4440 domain-containing protein [Flavobacterium sp.]
MRKTCLICIIIFILVGCSKKEKLKKDNMYLKLEIIQTEKDFEKLVLNKGLAEGFYQYADSNATIKRENDTLITGKNNIKNYYSNPKFKSCNVSWEPEFVDISGQGDMAYTYGTYIWTKTDSMGIKQNSKGVFHTVWKKQKDGSWKYVWD